MLVRHGNMSVARECMQSMRIKSTSLSQPAVTNRSWHSYTLLRLAFFGGSLLNRIHRCHCGEGSATDDEAESLQGSVSSADMT
jgi:hypothetical protein